jgi:hypothetical protein
MVWQWYCRQPPTQAKCSNILCMPNCVKLKIIMYHLCQIALNRTLSCKFSSCIEVKSYKKNLRKRRSAYTDLLQQEQQNSMDATDCEFFQQCMPLWLPTFPEGRNFDYLSPVLPLVMTEQAWLLVYDTLQDQHVGSNWWYILQKVDSSCMCIYMITLLYSWLVKYKLDLKYRI